MLDGSRAKPFEETPIGKGLDTYRTSFRHTHGNRSVPDVLDQLADEDLQNLILDLLSDVRNLPAVRSLPSERGRGTLRKDVLRLTSAVTSDDFDYNRIKPLLNAALSDELNDGAFWEQLHEAATEPTPPPRSIASSLQQTPWIHNTSSFVNSSEHRQHVDGVLKQELGLMYVGLPDFCDKYFEDVANLETSSNTFFKHCQESSDPLFNQGWRGWPDDANQDDVLSWLVDFTEKLADFVEDATLTPTCRRRLLAKPNNPIDGSVGKRKMDVGFTDVPEAQKDSRCKWSQILVPGELKKNPFADKPSEAWLDLGRYAREVFAAQVTRRFVLGFTICGSLMRVWIFDRVGGIASEQFDINVDGFRFVFIILGFFWMSKEQLGFDPTIMREDNVEFIEIERDGSTERIIIDEVILRAPCIAGRATTCWQAHREGYPRRPLVIKDSWQYPERGEEGELLQFVTMRRVSNVARYYWHGTVQIQGTDDDIWSNVRKGIDVTRATNYQSQQPKEPTNIITRASRTGPSVSTDTRKRSSSRASISHRPTKRICSTSPVKGGIEMPPNRIHRRVIICDYGRPIYKASSRSALLAAFEGCIQGYEALHEAGFLHRDISINNLMINEDESNPSWRSFLIDLDLAVREQRECVSGAKSKTGTRAFMAIGALLGEQHSFMHDLESFFWVLFWICIHYIGPGEGSPVEQFDKWNSMNTGELARMKLGIVAEEDIFCQTLLDYCTQYYQPLIPYINNLRKLVFPGGGRWKRKDKGLYGSMLEVIHEAQKDPKVLGNA